MRWLHRTTPMFIITNKERNNYQSTHALLRVIRNGLDCKRIVDDVIDECASNINLRGTIEDSRLAAETCVDEQQKKRFIERGLTHLKRYFILIVFQSFLDQNDPDSTQRTKKFSAWYAKHPEFDSIRQEINGLLALTPVEYLIPGDGIALNNEVLDVVNGRRGAVVAQGTIIKVYLSYFQYLV